MATLNFDFSSVTKFADKLQRLKNVDIKAEAAQWLDALGLELLRIVEDEIIRRQVVDSRDLLHSFSKGDQANVWEITDGGLTLKVGTRLEYAKFVNDGHRTIDPSKGNYFYLPSGEMARFVPGVWHGVHFEYIPGAKTGMVLKQQWIDAQPYWTSALMIFEKMFPDLVGAKFKQWLNQYLA